MRIEILCLTLASLTLTIPLQGGDREPSGEHWAYVPPSRPALPETRTVQLSGGQSWVRNGIDAFILRRLTGTGLTPSREASRPRQIRRLYLDLIGLPPSVEVVDAFLADSRPDAWERLVDRLLQSPHYGERWARPWLDLARYADSNGFQRDGHRSVWPYRDWVVDALNEDMPFDRFTLEQVAGDLLPDATVSQRVATGFHRCTTVNVEAGVDEEENRVNAVLDRVNTTATVWLGTTLECAQCHDHKYDPFSQEEYFRFFAYFNSTSQETVTKGSDSGRQFSGPYLTLPQKPVDAARHLAIQALYEDEERALEALELEELAHLPSWEREVRDDAARWESLPQTARRAILTASDARTQADQKKVRESFLAQRPIVSEARSALERRAVELNRLKPPQTLVMVELDEKRPTHVFDRGSFLEPRQRVAPGTPRALHPLRGEPRGDRLDLARWLADPRNPLVARVTVNRWWAEIFGQGLVRSPEDFGARADPPSHPELLDWLAVEFLENGSSRKRLHRLLVTSATYRQSSRVSPEQLERDPENRLYARAPRFRLSAETIRDTALAISGRLSPRLGGPPVLPHQPEGIWTVTGNVNNRYEESTGEDLFRRGLYTTWRRSSPYPSFVAFDAPDRAATCVRRPRTNTPLQALTLLNDPVYVELALALALRIVHHPVAPAAPDSAMSADSSRVEQAFRLCLSRHPTPEEEFTLLELLRGERRRLMSDASPAWDLIRSTNTTALGEMIESDADAKELAAWFAVGTVLLNLDEVITKG